MLTTDLALKVDPAYEKISRRFHENPDEFADAFARAWYKLTHRDMGPRSRYLGPLVPGGAADLAGPGAARRSSADRRRRDRRAQGEDPRLGSVGARSWWNTAWASAATFRGTDKRGGANGARIRLAPQKDWEVNEPGRARKGDRGAREDPGRFNESAAKVSLADLIVLGGCAAVEQAAKAAGHDVDGPVLAGPPDAIARADRRRLVRACSSPVPTGSVTTSSGRADGRRRCWSSEPTC